MLRTGTCYLKAAFFTLAVTAWILAEATLLPVWGAAPDQQEDICTNAAVIMCENWEDRALGTSDLGRAKYKNPGWLTTLPQTGMTVIDASSGNVYNGNRGLQFRYLQNEEFPGQMETVSPNDYPTLYWRYYTRFSSNWKFSSIGTKGFETVTQGGQSVYAWWNGAGFTDANELAQYTQNVSNPVAYRGNVNGGPFIITPGQWYCLELRVTYNTGASNGTIQFWVDDVLRADHPNIKVESPAGMTIEGWILSTYWNMPGTHPLMYRWFDNFVISRERIGCLSRDTTTPAPPTGLRVN